MFLRFNSFIINLFSPRSKVTVAAVSFLVLSFLGYIDYKSGDYSLIVFYLVPVSLVAWFVSRPAGLAFCVLTLLTRFAADQSSSLFVLHRSASLHYWNMVIEFLFLLIMSVLFSTLRSTLEKEKTLASTDSLTGTLNRRSFFDLAEYELHRSRRYKQPFTVAYIDIDNFKMINDCLGHHIGDELLITVVSTISAHIRSTDILARLGGDEFVLLLPETHAEAGRVFLEKLHSNMQSAMDGKNWPVSFSIGAISYADTPDSIDLVVQQADALMYEVKHSGRNRLLFKDANEVTNG